MAAHQQAGHLDASRSRTTLEVVQDHLALQRAGRLDDDIAHNYDGDVVIFGPDGVHRGAEAVRSLRRRIDARSPLPALHYARVLVDGDVAMVAWTARGDGVHFDEGTDTLVVRDGRIIAQTVHFVVHSAPHR